MSSRSRRVFLLLLVAAMTFPRMARGVSGTPSEPASTSPDSSISLPAVTGRDAIGTFTEYLVDSMRVDTTTGRSRPRPLSVQIWYPAWRTASGPLAGYAPGIDTTANEYGRLMSRVRGHAQWRVPFARGMQRAPIIVFSTGRTMAAYDYSAIAEDLASHGYIVVGVNSPRLSRFSTAEGEVIPALPPPPLAVLQHFDDADVFFEPMVRQVAADLRFVVERLDRADRSDPILKGHLDLRRLAMMGHSNGALAASRACAEEERCRAFIGIEGTQTREIRKSGVRKPYALLISEQSIGFDTENVYRELGTRSGSLYGVVIVKGAGHNTFTDLLLVRPTLFHYSMAPQRGVDITRAALRTFFDESLLGQKRGGLRAALRSYSEVRVQTSF